MAEGDTEEAYAQNRRDEFVIIAGGDNLKTGRVDRPPSDPGVAVLRPRSPRSVAPGLRGPRPRSRPC